MVETLGKRLDKRAIALMFLVAIGIVVLFSFFQAWRVTPPDGAQSRGQLRYEVPGEYRTSTEQQLSEPGEERASD